MQQELPTSARSAYSIATVVGCHQQRTTGSSNLQGSSIKPHLRMWFFVFSGYITGTRTADLRAKRVFNRNGRWLPPSATDGRQFESAGQLH